MSSAVAGKLSGKTAFVTGAAQGIGRSIAEALAREGAVVVAADLQPVAPDQAATQGIQWLQLDVTDPEAMRRIADQHRDIGVLVNCVGIVPTGSVLDTSAAVLSKSFDVNVVSMFNTISALLPSMLAAGEGSIVNIASVVSSTKAVVNRFAYATTKAAVIGLTKSVARDFIDRGIRCNSISPGTVMTPSLQERIDRQGDPSALGAFLARQPMGRFGRSEEIAEIAVMLASDAAKFMTGSDIIVDGGMSL
ncbi:SDR family oxidoreductase [Steroidobacter sp.]|uniref:SDR family oxidoreductase n=1 Tax=Steroidobacter sp. TaxID=1978227 RepID=UPI001A4DCF40|nr:SDR family oxidoreductase [Steroidobacter sp.]MBL8267078.1 SDR family oxidoreductase [Steroidobacter sp.]